MPLQIKDQKRYFESQVSLTNQAVDKKVCIHTLLLFRWKERKIIIINFISIFINLYIYIYIYI